MLVRKLLIVELPRPYHPDFPALVGKEAHQSEHAGLGDESEREGDWTGHIGKHPRYSSNEEQGSSSDQVDSCISGRIKSSEVG